MDIPILYEDDDLLVVNKPPGVVVNRAQSVKGETVQDWAEQKLNIVRSDATISWGDSFESRAGIAHRIDKETSGILLIGKNPEAFEKLQADFKERSMKKTYLALVHGKIAEDGEINAPVGRLPWDRERFGVDAGGKEAVTNYVVRRSWFVVHGKNKEEISLVELHPETGRTHQIRVHMKYINHPLIGDYLYAGRKTSRNDRLWAERCMLHAWKITLTHPKSGASLAFEAPIPDDMERIIQ